MKIKTVSLTMICAAALLLISLSPVSADEPAGRDWHFSLNTVYSSRTLKGDLINKSALADGVFGNLVATGDSINVGTSNALMIALAAQYKRWGLGLNYMPTSFSGQGWAISDLSGDGGGLWVRTPLSTNIDINLLLGNVCYNLIQTPNSIFGIGAGLGQTAIDLKIIPDVGSPILYNGNQPFGFLSMYMANTYKRFVYGFNLNGISGTFDGAKVEYSDYKITLGYRVMEDKIKCDIIGGYRMVNFAIDIKYDQNVVATGVTLAGPFVGINLVY